MSVSKRDALQVLPINRAGGVSVNRYLHINAKLQCMLNVAGAEVHAYVAAGTDTTTPLPDYSVKISLSKGTRHGVAACPSGPATCLASLAGAQSAGAQCSPPCFSVS